MFRRTKRRIVIGLLAAALAGGGAAVNRDAGCTADRDEAERDTASHGLITGNVMTGGLLHLWSIRKVSTSRQFYVSVK